MRSSGINQGSLLQADLFEDSRPKRAMKTPVAVPFPSTYVSPCWVQAGTGAMSGFVALPQSGSTLLFEASVAIKR